MLGSLISAGSSLLGGLFGSKSKDEAAEKNAALQKEFAQNSLQWKAADAKKAGIHPVYAMGAPTYTPSSVYDGSSPVGQSLASAGQDIGRAIDATRTAPQKLDAYTLTAQKLDLENKSLNNDILRADLAAKVSRSIQSPPFPTPENQFLIEGQPQSGVSDKALERIKTAHGHPYSEPGSVADVGFTNTYSGGLAPVYSADAKQRLEDDTGGMLAWNARNRLLPSLTFGALGPQPPIPAGKGKAWVFNPVKQEYVRVDKDAWWF